MRYKNKLRTQPRMRGVKRLPMGTALRDITERRIRRDCARYECSRSYLIASIVITYYQTDIDKALPEVRKQ